MGDLKLDIRSIFQQAYSQHPAQTVEAISNLANKYSDTECDAYLKKLPELQQYQTVLKKVYSDYILHMEAVSVKGIISNPTAHSLDFLKVASSEAATAYHRVDGTFDRINLKNAKVFTMVGCGQLPVTAIQAHERSQEIKVMALDISPSAIESVNQLKTHCGLSRIEAVCCNGAEYDYSRTDIIYVANMVSPKLLVWNQIQATADRQAQVIIREPYSLGRLWADSLENALGNHANITYRGPGSRYLSRDVFYSL